jgi:hypothetical protein
MRQGPDGEKDVGGPVADLPDEFRLELLRAGYIEVDGPGLTGVQRHLPGDHLAEVVGTTVRLQA